jgi:ABC-2 type transport system permease protein
VNPRITLATAARVLRQLRGDRRTVAMLMVVPSLLMVLLRYVLDSSPFVFDEIGLQLLGIFPFVTMFLVTSVAMLRERTSGTLERLLTTRLAKLDLLLGYALAFGIAALVQVGIATAVTMGWLGLQIVSGVGWAVVLAVASALLGMALGLLVSAFATTEFQAVQFMPAVVLPQILLCGMLVPRSHMLDVLNWLSDVLPLSYVVDGMARARTSTAGAGLVGDVAVVIGCILAALAIGAVTLRRRTP